MNSKEEFMTMILKDWKRHRERKREEEQRKKEMEEQEWQPSASDLDHIKKTVWKIQPGDEHFKEFYEMYEIYGGRAEDEAMGLYIEEDKEECIATNPENPYRAALDLAWSRVDPDLFKSPQDKANPMDFDDVMM